MKIVIAPDSYKESLLAMIEATGGEIIRVQVTRPLSKPVEAFFGLSGVAPARLSKWLLLAGWSWCAATIAIRY